MQETGHHTQSWQEESPAEGGGSSDSSASSWWVWAERYAGMGKLRQTGQGGGLGLQGQELGQAGQ